MITIADWYNNEAKAEDVRSPKVIVDQYGNPLAGTMPDNGSYVATAQYGAYAMIPKGYHDGNGYIKCGVFNFTRADATTANVLEGKKFFGSDGKLLIGSMTNFGNGWIDPGTLGIDEGSGIHPVTLDGSFKLSLDNVVGFVNRPYTTLWMRKTLDESFGSSIDRSNGNEIRSTPTDLADNTNSYHYTGRVAGIDKRWHEVIVYGWQHI